MDGQKAVHPLGEAFYLLSKDSLAVKKKNHPTVWDPWPVDNLRDANDEVFAAARIMLQQRNHQSVDNLVDRIVLLPASSAQGSKIQGGSCGMWLYSVRSPSVLPMRINLWMTPGRKVMVRQGPLSISFDRFISSWPGSEERPEGPCKHYHVWKSVKITDRWLETVPKYLHQQIYSRWWAMNGFPFLDLPFELREMVLRFIIGHRAEPYIRRYHYRMGGRLTPNMSIARVNKQLHHEVMQALIAHTKFVFEKSCRLLKFFQRSERILRTVRYLILDMMMTELLPVFGVIMTHSSRPRIYRYRLQPSTLSSSFRSICADSRSLRHLRVNFPSVTMTHPGWGNACQEAFCMAFWAGARAVLRHIPSLGFEGFICKDLKQFFLEEHERDKREFALDEREYQDWQRTTVERGYA